MCWFVRMSFSRSEFPVTRPSKLSSGGDKVGVADDSGDGRAKAEESRLVCCEGKSSAGVSDTSSDSGREGSTATCVGEEVSAIRRGPS
jgi:hypothetical protein